MTYLRVGDLKQIVANLPDDMFVYLEMKPDAPDDGIGEIAHLIGHDATDCWDADEGTALLLIAQEAAGPDWAKHNDNADDYAGTDR